MLTKCASNLALLALVALSATSAMAGPAGTLIEVTKTASATWTQINTYDWTIEKTPLRPDQVTYVVLPGDTVQVGFNVKATRLGPDVDISNTPVSGEICIENTGLRATQNLYLVDQLEVYEDGEWVAAHPPFPINTLGEVSAGQRKCFPYEISVTLDPEKAYRNVATASLDNYLGREGMNTNLSTPRDVELTVRNIDVRKNITVRDTFSCATGQGFECDTDWVDQSISDTRTFTYTESVKNVSAKCGNTVTMLNTAFIDFDETGVSMASLIGPSVLTSFYTGSCRLPSIH